MPQLSLFLDDAAMENLRLQSKRAGVSMSRFVSDLLRENSTGNRWPSGYWDKVYGSLTDSTFIVDGEAELDPALDD